jgi:predicted transcriptional regulator
MTPTEKLILRDLELGPATVRDLVPVVNLRRYSVGRVIRKMQKKGLVYICSWETRRGGRAAVWGVKKLAANKDVPRPRRLTVAEMDRRHREKAIFKRSHPVCIQP